MTELTTIKNPRHTSTLLLYSSSTCVNEALVRISKISSSKSSSIETGVPAVNVYPFCAEIALS